MLQGIDVNNSNWVTGTAESNVLLGKPCDGEVRPANTSSAVWKYARVCGVKAQITQPGDGLSNVRNSPTHYGSKLEHLCVVVFFRASMFCREGSRVEKAKLLQART